MKKQWGIYIVLVVMVWYKMDLLKQLDDMVLLVVGENSLILQVGEGVIYLHEESGHQSRIHGGWWSVQP